MIELELPYPPSINHYWRRVGMKTLISREGRRFRERVVSIMAAMKIESLSGNLDVEIRMFPPDARRRDIDNIIKSLLDAMQHGGAYADDGQIYRLTIEKCLPVEDGKVVVLIKRSYYPIQ